MKPLLRTLLPVLFFISLTHVVRADGGYSFDVTCDQKKLEAKAGADGIGVTRKKEIWGYKVAIVNRSFKDASNVEIRYISFMKPDEAGERTPGGPAVLKRSPEGNVKVPLIKNLEKYEFATEPMTLISTQLKPGYIWASGANQTSRDVLRGLWLRIFIDGQQVSEFFTPASLKDREKWDNK